MGVTLINFIFPKIRLQRELVECGAHVELEYFYFNLNLLLSNNQHLACSIVTGDFHAKFSKWCTTDKNNAQTLN